MSTLYCSTYRCPKTAHGLTGERGKPLCEGCHAFWKQENLRAAAPELLEALKDLYAQCAMIHKYGGEACNQREANAAIARGLAAIAKAEGRA